MKRDPKTGQVLPTHGLTKHPFYPIWRAMRQRCYHESYIQYPDYGGRGIRVCKEWRDTPVHFIEWLEENGYENGLQIDRIDNDGDYTPENCHIVTRSENCRNRRSTVLYNVFDRDVTAAEVVEWTGIGYSTFVKRIKVHGWSPTKAAFTPVGG